MRTRILIIILFLGVFLCGWSCDQSFARGAIIERLEDATRMDDGGRPSAPRQPVETPHTPSRPVEISEELPTQDEFYPGQTLAQTTDRETGNTTSLVKMPDGTVKVVERDPSGKIISEVELSQEEAVRILSDKENLTTKIKKHRDGRIEVRQYDERGKLVSRERLAVPTKPEEAGIIETDLEDWERRAAAAAAAMMTAEDASPETMTAEYLKNMGEQEDLLAEDRESMSELEEAYARQDARTEEKRRQEVEEQHRIQQELAEMEYERSDEYLDQERQQLRDLIKQDAAHRADMALQQTFEDHKSDESIWSKASWGWMAAHMTNEGLDLKYKSLRDAYHAGATLAAINNYEQAHAEELASNPNLRRTINDMRFMSEMRVNMAEQTLTDTFGLTVAGAGFDALTAGVGGAGVKGYKALRSLIARQAGRQATRGAVQTASRALPQAGVQATGREAAEGATTRVFTEGAEDLTATQILPHGGREFAETQVMTQAGREASEGATTRMFAPEAAADAAFREAETQVMTQAGREASQAARSSASSAASRGSQVVDSALRTKNMAAESALAKKLEQAAAQAEQSIQKAIEEGVELTERQANKFYKQIVARNYNQQMNQLLEHARQAGVSEKALAEATKNARTMPNIGGTIGVQNLTELIVKKTGKTVLSLEQAAPMLQTITRVHSGNASRAEVELLRRGIEAAQRNGKNYFAELANHGTVTSGAGYQPLVDKSTIEALKRFARTHGLIQ